MSCSPTETASALVDVVMPRMGTSVAEGTVVAWSRQVGDAVAADEPLCDISTDKVETECPSPAAGVLAEIVVAVGETVDVGAVLARIATEGAPLAPAPAPARVGGYSPVVRRIAQTHGVDLAAVAGSGRGGRVTKRDVLGHVEQREAEREERPLHSESPYRPEPVAADPAARAAAAPAADDRGGVPAPLSHVRRRIGAAMRASIDTAATCHTVVECDMTRVEQRRRELGLTALPLVARATVETLRDFPELNATLDGDTVTRYARVHLGIAVSLGGEALIVPVIADAQELSPEGLARRIKDLAVRARGKRLSPDEVGGATFTITNPGAFGAVAATPIIDVPQVAILDLEAIVRRPVVVAGSDGAEAIAIRPIGNLILGWDHRALDGVYAAQFLTALRGRLEQPAG